MRRDRVWLLSIWTALLSDRVWLLSIWTALLSACGPGVVGQGEGESEVSSTQGEPGESETTQTGEGETGPSETETGAEESETGSEESETGEPEPEPCEPPIEPEPTPQPNPCGEHWTDGSCTLGYSSPVYRDYDALLVRLANGDLISAHRVSNGSVVRRWRAVGTPLWSIELTGHSSRGLAVVEGQVYSLARGEFEGIEGVGMLGLALEDAVTLSERSILAETGYSNGLALIPGEAGELWALSEHNDSHGLAPSDLQIDRLSPEEGSVWSTSAGADGGELHDHGRSLTYDASTGRLYLLAAVEPEQPSNMLEVVVYAFAPPMPEPLWTLVLGEVDAYVEVRDLALLPEGRVAALVREGRVRVLDGSGGELLEEVEIGGPGSRMVGAPDGGLHVVYGAPGEQQLVSLDAALSPTCETPLVGFSQRESFVDALAAHDDGMLHWAGMAEIDYSFQFGHQFGHAWGRLR